MAPPDSRRFVIDMYSSRHPLWSMPEAHVARIRDALPGWEVVRIMDEADGSGDGVPRATPRLLDAIREAEVYCGFGISRALFREAKALRWVHSGSAGVGGSLFPELVESDEVLLTNSAGIHAVPVAEHAVAMMFYFARGLDRVERNRRNGRWGRERLAGADSPVGELTGATLGVIGYGGIGRAIADRGRALGMQVVAVRRRPSDAGLEGVRVLGPERLADVLGASDYLVLSVPHTAETDGLIGPAELARMKPGAVLINIARGELVDEAALAEALRSGGLRGAGLDVFREEPLPPSSPLWDLENVLITPHVAGVTPRFWERETELIVRNIERYLGGEPLLNRVDKRAGY